MAILFWFPLFLISVFIFFTIPILYFIDNLFESFWEKIILSTVIGYVCFSLITYFLLIIKAEFLIIPATISINFLYFKKNLHFFKKITYFSKLKLFLFISTVTVGIIGQLAVISPSGLNLNKQLVFWSAHGHDGLWHIALIEEIKKGYPFQNPVFAGEKLVNYHYFSDIPAAFFSKYLNFPTMDLYFRFFPFLYSLSLGSLAFILAFKLTKSYLAGFWSMIFIYFSGSFGYIVTFLKDRSIGGESIFWSSQTQSSIGNPPEIAALVITLAFLILFLENSLHSKNWKLIILSIILAGSLAVIKVYSSVIILSSLLVVGLFWIITKKSVDILGIFLSSTILSAILYLPNSTQSSSFLIFQPWWFIRTMIVVPERLNWLDMELKRQTYLSEHNYKRVLQLELTGFLIFLFGNLGTKFIGFFSAISLAKILFKNTFNQLFILIILISFLLPIFFLQKGVAGNSIQFMQSFLLLFCILSGITVSKIFSVLKNKILITILSITLIILSVPTQIGNLYNFYSRPPFAKVSSAEIEALSYLKQIPDSSKVILTAPFQKNYHSSDATPPIWAWSDTAYVSAISIQRTYLADLEQVDIMGYKYKDRLKFQADIFNQTDSSLVLTKLQAQKIDYIYFPKALKPKVNLSNTNFKKIFENSEVQIWKNNY